ncbi:hypothetical protein F4808DRAFT_107968 [Astrocystis sublimbata]|nr:hypothetical protein F4808DRAFT_107968 [Astrocystis sublimbata]
MTTTKTTRAKEGEGREETVGGAANRDDGLFELKAHCLCQTHRFTSQVPRSSIPLEAVYCHCTSCRHVTGSLYSTYVIWRGDVSEIKSRSRSQPQSRCLKRYKFSERLAILFCGVCSTTMFWEKRVDDDDHGGNGDGGDGVIYGVFTGVLANVDISGLVRISDHVFLDDTVDGGAVPWLCDSNHNSSDRPPRLWRGQRHQSEELPVELHNMTLDESAPAPDASEDSTPQTEIPIRCHCGGVNLILRPSIADFAAAAARGDELPWFVDPASHKSRASFDACDSCRLWSGSDIYYWTFVLLRHLSFPDTHSPTSQTLYPCEIFPSSSLALKDAVSAIPEKRDPRWGTLTFYESSPDVQRYSCSRCSACVFYAVDDRPEMVDLAIGLLDTNAGQGDRVRAEDLLAWEYGGNVPW